MANHVRQQIREAAAALLLGLTTTQARVFQSRVHVLNDSNLPCLLVSTNEEQAEIASIGFPSLLNRQLNLQVRAIAKANADLNDTLDNMIKEVEAALNASVAANTLSGLAKNIELNSIFIDMNADAEKTTGQAVISFNVNYKTSANTPDTSI